MTAVSNENGGFFFIYGYGGTGKTFLYNTIVAALRSKGDIVLIVVSSGIASLLLPSGRTAHFRFRIPLNVNEDIICNIKPGSDLAELLDATKLIIWDEAPMMHKYCFDALDRTLKDILKSSSSIKQDMPFAGKVMVLGGDFRQILPVVPKGTRQEIVAATINSSYLWKYCQVLTLTKNMRLTTGSSPANPQEMAEFSSWLLNIGDGDAGVLNDGETDIDLPEDLCVQCSHEPLIDIVNSTYPEFLTKMHDPNYCQERAILAPTIEVVKHINDYMISLMPGDEKVFLSADSTCKSFGNGMNDIHTPEFLNNITLAGLPNHKLSLKVGVPIMLLRNIDLRNGLCNGTRLIITQLGNYVIEAKIISGSNSGEKVFIPRMNLTSSDRRMPFQLKRRQFPVQVCFAMTIKKSQGQSLSHIGLYLPRPIFSHGQLYVAFSRVRSRSGLKVLSIDSDGTILKRTKNVVYKEVFHKINRRGTQGGGDPLVDNHVHSSSNQVP